MQSEIVILFGEPKALCGKNQLELSVAWPFCSRYFSPWPEWPQWGFSEICSTSQWRPNAMLCPACCSGSDCLFWAQPAVSHHGLLGLARSRPLWDWRWESLSQDWSIGSRSSSPYKVHGDDATPTNSASPG